MKELNGIVLNQLDKWAEIAFNYESDLFGCLAVDAEELIDISFSSTFAKLVYMVESGQHIVHAIPISEFLSWVDHTEKDLQGDSNES